MRACSLLDPKVECTDNNILEAMKSLEYPVLVSTKVDGIRAVRTTDLYSVRMKLIPNISIRRRSMVLPYGFDMELYNPELTYSEINSIVMSEEHPDSDKIQFHILDWYSNMPYEDRCESITRLLNTKECNGMVWSDPRFEQATFNYNLFQLFSVGEALGSEGICFRTPSSPYKQGRSTLTEQYLVKLCRYIRAEVIIVGFLESKENTNSAGTSNIGLMERSHRKSGMVGKETLGALLVEDKDGRTYKVGTGFSEKLREEIWMNQSSWLGKRITEKHKPHGEKDNPRHPVFVGLREEGY